MKKGYRRNHALTVKRVDEDVFGEAPNTAPEAGAVPKPGTNGASHANGFYKE